MGALASPRVLVAAELRDLLPPDPLPGYEVCWIAAEEPTPQGDFVGFVTLLRRKIGEAELDGLPELKVLAQCAVGYDNLDIGAAIRRGVVVTHTPGVLTEATADLTWALILAVARRLKEGQEMIASGRWTAWAPTQLLGMELQGATLGIVGAGRIGQAVGRRGVAFGMRLLYADPEAKGEFENRTGAVRKDLDELLAESDVVTLHVPSLPGTQGLLDAARLERMKPGALLINTARGDVVDEKALIAALQEGRLGGVGLDVYRDEPQVPPELVAHPRAVCLPHIGSATHATRRRMAELALANARAVLEGRAPPTPVEGTWPPRLRPGALPGGGGGEKGRARGDEDR